VVRPLDFTFLSTVTKSEVEGKSSAAKVGGVRVVTYADNTVQRYKLMELSDASNYVTYSLISSTPQISFGGYTTTVTLRRVTTDNSTLVEVTTDVAADASQAVIQDRKFKAVDYVNALSTACESKATKVFRALNFASLERLTTKQVKSAWKTFDKNGDGVLDKSEVALLVDALLKRISEEQSDVFVGLSNLFEESKEVEQKDLAKSIFKDLQKQSKRLTRELLGRLDQNHDGKIDASEFQVCFGSFFQKKISQGIADCF
jgi:Ca2+-binding EF-hand superfamily protein